LQVLEGKIMADKPQAETKAENGFCPECGAAEDGFFCRKCGALLHGEERVLCPRCHQVVPDGEYCNQCGQSLAGLALHLRQLALAGDEFWVTSEATTPSPVPQEMIFEPDETVVLAAPELPQWLQELPTQAAPREGDTRIYPALRPIVQPQESTAPSRSFLAVVIVFMLILMLGLMFLAFYILLRGGA
jgi:hypothetical protein